MSSRAPLSARRARPPSLALASSTKRPLASVLQLDIPAAPDDPDDDSLRFPSPSPTSPAYATPIYDPRLDPDSAVGSDDLIKDFAVVEQLRRSVQKNLRLRPIRVPTPPLSPSTSASASATTRPLSSSSTWSDYSQQPSASPSSSVYYTPISDPPTRSPPTSAHYIGPGAFEIQHPARPRSPARPRDPASLARTLAADPPRRPLLLDTRPVAAYLASRITHSINLAIPSLILKRLRKPAGGFQALDALRPFITTEQGKDTWDHLMRPAGPWDGDVVIYDDEMNERDRPAAQTTAWALLPVVDPLLFQGSADYLQGGLRAALAHPDLSRFVTSSEHDRDLQPHDAPSPTQSPQPPPPPKPAKKGLGLAQLDTTSASKHTPLPELERSAGASPLPMMMGSWNISDLSPSPPPSQSVFPRPPPPRRPSLSALRRIDTRSAERLHPGGGGAAALPKLQVRTVPLRSATLAAPPMNGAWPSSPRAHSPSHLTLVHSNHTPPSSARLYPPPPHSPSFAASSEFLLPPSPSYAAHPRTPRTPRTPTTPTGLPPSPRTARPDFDALALASASAAPSPASSSLSSLSSGEGDALPAFSISTILPHFLFLGPEITAEAHVAALRALGVRRIVNIAAECDDDRGLRLRERFERYVRIPMRDTVEEENITRGVREVCEILGERATHTLSDVTML